MSAIFNTGTKKDEMRAIEEAFMSGLDEDQMLMIEQVATVDENVENWDEFARAICESELVENLSADELEEFIESPEAKALEEAGLINRKTIVRLNKNDDLTRRTKIAAFQIAKEKNDPIWQKLVTNRIKEKLYIATIMKKYSMAGTRDAKKAQRDHLSTGSTMAKVLTNFGKGKK